jgi:hypothetical protein
MSHCQRPISGSLRVRTLLAHVPINSLGLKTTLLGRLVFLCVSTSITILLLRQFPLNFLPHFLLLLSCSIAVCLIGAARLLVTRPVLMLFSTCCLLGIVNLVLAPDSAGQQFQSRISYGGTRAAAFASLSFCTLLVGAITRPSDFSRLTNRFTPSAHITILLAVPFTTFDFLATTFQDILTVGNARCSKLPYVKRLHKRVIDAGSSLLATALIRALYLYQGSCALETPRRASQRYYLLDRYPLLRIGDIFLLLVFLPESIAPLIWNL